MEWHLLTSSLPVINQLLGGLGEGLLDGIDFVGLIFGFLSELTFLVDVFVAAAIVAALVRGLFKKFWKVAWRGFIFVLLAVALIIFVDQVAAQLGGLGLKLEGEADGVAFAFATLGETLEGVIVLGGKSAAEAEALSNGILRNLALFIGVPVLALITPLVSGITFPLINLLIPKKMKKIKFIPVKIVISLGFSLFALVLFAVPMQNLLSTDIIALQDTMTDGSLLQKFLNPEIIGFMRLFTAEHSIFIKIVEFGQIGEGLGLFAKVDGASIKETMLGVLSTLDAIVYSKPA